jgi:UDP-N-acetylglucosamine 1-carboxyvinyltransferase
MDRILIRGGRPLNGSIPISGAKNAALPLMIASLLSDQTLHLENVPDLADVRELIRLLTQHGVRVERDVLGDGSVHSISLKAEEIVSTTAPYEIVSRMRASFWVIGPLLARCREARVSLPGGCAIGPRPVDLHLKGLQELGADIDIDQGYVIARAPNGLQGATIRFPSVTVGATHNVMMAATLAKGRTVIENAAREPEIGDLAACLNAMGAHIEGAGTGQIVIDGVEKLTGARHRVVADRIEAGTFCMAFAMTGGAGELIGAHAEHLGAMIAVLAEAGIDVSAREKGLKVARRQTRQRAVTVTTQPFPGFPTDLQAQLMALMCTADGTSHIRETIFENRFMHVQELARLGADISLHGDLALVHGVERLKGAPVMATDLRASVSLVIAALAAEGETILNRVYHLDRGFERLETKLSACGADITRLMD